MAEDCHFFNEPVSVSLFIEDRLCQPSTSSSLGDHSESCPLLTNKTMRWSIIIIIAMLVGSSGIVRLDHVARALAPALALDDDASLGGVAAAAAAVDQEARPAAHVVGRRGIQVALQSICAL